MREAGAEDAVNEILETFLTDAKDRRVALADALDSGEPDVIRAAAHAFRSPASAIGAGPLSALLLSIETAGKEKRVDDARALGAKTQEEVDAVIAYLNALPGDFAREVKRPN